MADLRALFDEIRTLVKEQTAEDNPPARVLVLVDRISRVAEEVCLDLRRIADASEKK